MREPLTTAARDSFDHVTVRAMGKTAGLRTTPLEAIQQAYDVNDASWTDCT